MNEIKKNGKHSPPALFRLWAPWCRVPKMAESLENKCNFHRFFVECRNSGQANVE